MADPWAELDDAPKTKLAELFAADPDRVRRLTVEECGLRFDFSKTHLDERLLAAFLRLAEGQGLAARRDAMFAGEPVNPTEGRAAEHCAERGQGAPESVARANRLHARMRALVDAVEAGAFGEVRHVLHVGIGGSALGPDLLIDALGRDSGRFDAAVVSNVDGAALEQAMRRFDPHSTLLAIASKTFTTSETMLNARSTVAWMEQAGVADPYGRIVALTASPDKAVEFGVDETRILPFAESVGGRYSLWSSIGFPAALALGWEAFETLLEGAAAMDRHFRLARPERNAPIIAAFVDRYYANVRGAETRAVFAYDERLRLLPPYLQQLEMESNGKSVTLDGAPAGRATAAIAWGSLGTDAQHAVFQLLHQGTHLVPVEFVAAIEPGHRLDHDHHHQLLTNCFAQGAALMAGRSSDDPHRSYPGDRPSTTILMDRIDPFTLGALIAFYEHRTFANAALLGINPFDDDVFGGVQVKMSAVVAGGPGLVAVGRAVDGVVGGAAVWTSVDGLVWARVPHDDDVFGGAAMESVTAGGPGLVAVGAAGSVWTSPDGLDWKLVYRANESMDGSAARMSSVVAHGSGLVAVGTAADGGGAFAAVWTSADGLDWSQVPRDGSVFGGGTAMNSVVAGGPGLVAVGEAMRARGSVAAVWTSVDGQVWSRVPHDAQLFGGRSRVQLDCNRHHDEALDDEPDHHRLWHVASWGSGLVALGSASQCGAQVAAVWTSTDGHVWSRVPHDDGAFGGGNPPELRDVVQWASGLVAVGAANLDATGNADAAVWLSPPPQPQGNSD